MNDGNRCRLLETLDAANARAEAAEACIGTLRDLLGCTPRNVADCTMEEHSREIMSAATARAEHFKAALVAMPEVTLQFQSRGDCDAWNAWKRKTFDDGEPVEPDLKGA